MYCKGSLSIFANCLNRGIKKIAVDSDLSGFGFIVVGFGFGFEKPNITLKIKPESKGESKGTQMKKFMNLHISESWTPFASDLSIRGRRARRLPQFL